ncbi:MAG TPA: nitroreductase [Gemmatimonadales bacterium]|jgi:nitroreductase
MDALDAIQRRTSVRRFRPDPIPRETIERLLDSAVRAPNHKLTQPWRFAVLTGDAIARFAALRARHRVKRYADPESPEARAAADKMRKETAETPAILVVMCAVSNDENTREEDYAATMMAIANLMIAAESLGLGTYLRTGGILREPELVSMVDLSPGYRIVGVVMLGYPMEVEKPKPRRPAVELTRWIAH